MKKIIKVPLLLLLTVALVSGCNDLSKTSSNKKSAKTQLSFQNTATNTGSAPAVTGSAAMNGTTATNSTSSSPITIDTAKVLVKRVEFQRAEGDSTESKAGSKDSTASSDSTKIKHEHSTEFAAGPFIVNLNPDTSVTTLAINNIPYGTYNGVSFKIHKPRPNGSISDSDFVSGENRYSVVVKGYYKGKHFVFKSQRTAEEHLFLNPPLVVSDSLSSFNVTVKVNVNNWFIGWHGNVLDPTNPKNREAINRAIEHSFRGIEDDNHDGHEDSHHHMGDHHEHHGNQGNNGNHDQNGNQHNGGDHGSGND